MPESSNHVLIFAYGSNMDPKQMKERCPNSELSTFLAEARGWRLCFPRESEKRKGGVGSVEPQRGSSVWGVVFSVDRVDLPRLDTREGVLIGSYTRGPVDLYKQNGEPVRAETYFAVRQREQDFIPHHDYIELYVRGAKHFGLPAEYLAFLDHLKTQAKR